VVDLVDLYQGQTLFLVLNGASLQGFDFERRAFAAWASKR
jgi:hypothetical protein